MSLIFGLIFFGFLAFLMGQVLSNMWSLGALVNWAAASMGGLVLLGYLGWSMTGQEFSPPAKEPLPSVRRSSSSGGGFYGGRGGGYYGGGGWGSGK